MNKFAIAIGVALVGLIAWYAYAKTKTQSAAAAALANVPVVKPGAIQPTAIPQPGVLVPPPAPVAPDLTDPSVISLSGADSGFGGGGGGGW